MRNLTIASLGASALALSGCSFFDGHKTNNQYSHTSAHHTAGAYQNTGAYNTGAYQVGTYQNTGAYQSVGTYPDAAAYQNAGAYKNAGTHHSSLSNGCCIGGNTLSKWNFEGDIGPEFIVGGDSFSGTKSHQNIAGQNLDNVSTREMYDTGYRASLGGSYALSPNRKLVGLINYANSSGNAQEIGVQNNNEPTIGKLSRYESLGVEAGLRQYFQPRIVGSSFDFRPYAEGRLGASLVDDISLTYYQQDTPNAAQTVDFYDKSWVPTAAALVGIETPVFDRATLGLETGIRYAGALESADELINQAPNLAGANNASERWTVPLTLRGRYRF